MIEAMVAIDTALRMLPQEMNSPQSRVMLLAIGLQESGLTERRQLVGTPPRPVGPAKGLWQFERRGGCKGVMTHAASRYWMEQACRDRGLVSISPTGLWNAIEHDDVLAAIAARLLLFTDPRLLPGVDDPDGAWRLYIRTWRPGKPHRLTWSGNHAVALILYEESK